MNLFRKILLAPTVAIVFLLIFAGVSYKSANTLHQALADLHNVRTKNLHIASDTKAGALEFHSGVYRLMTWAGALDEKRVAEDAKALLAQADKLLSGFSKWLDDPSLSEQEKQLGKQIAEMLATYRQSASQAVDLATIDINTALASMQNADDNFKKLGQLTEV